MQVTDKSQWRIAARLLGLCLLVSSHPVVGADCHVGSYHMSDGSVLDIAPSEGETLRWRRFDGTTGALHKTAAGEWKSTYGWTGRPDGKSAAFSGCGSLEFDGMHGEQIAFKVRNTVFSSHDTNLAGRLVMPLGENKVAVVVLVHGSEPDSALDTYFLQRLLPAQGIGAFVYDKRGTGRSAGTYTQDFNLLADDAVAAMREARRLAGARLRRIGYQAGSQGGWVAPLAAERARVDFVIVCFGLAVSVIDEDQQEVEIEMREKGHSPTEITEALEVATAAEGVIASGFKDGFSQFDAARAKYRGAPWYKDLHGNYTYLLLPYSEAELRKLGDTQLSWTRTTPFHYDPMPVLRAATVPQLWIVGGEDYEAPSAETSRRIKDLIAVGRPFTLACYPDAEHGMTLFEVSADGSRDSTRYAPGYFAMIRDFARDGRFTGTYGIAELTMPRAGNRPRSH